MAVQTTPQKTRQQFSRAVSGKVPEKKLYRDWRVMAAGGAILVFIVGYFSFGSSSPRLGNNLYGICRVYIERHLQFPETMKIIQFEQRIPEGEDPKNIKRIEIDITFSSTDGFGQNTMNTITCGFRTEDRLMKTPWNGILLERVLYNNRIDHGWADAYQPQDKKNPRAPDDRSEDLEMFNQGIPAIIAYPPDLTLPRYNLKYMSVERLKNL